MESKILDSITEKLKSCNIYKQPEGWVIEYPQFTKPVDEQMHTFWPFDEPEVENDVQDLRVKLTEAEYHGVVENLKLFTTYEMHVGDDYWTGRIMKRFKRPELQRAASMFSAVEFNSHSPFYNKINELLYLDNEEFYGSWREDEVLTARMKFIGDMASSKNDLLSIGAFSFIEGAVLYTSFAFFKHFQTQECGKDLIKNICRGINLSVADENTHAVFGAMLYRTLLQEANLNEEELAYMETLMKQIAVKTYEHECKIIDMTYDKGDIKGLPKKALQDFVKHRCNLCLQNLGYDIIFSEDTIDTFVQDWFYENINSYQFHDFFTANGSEYTINWKEERFGQVWK